MALYAVKGIEIIYTNRELVKSIDPIYLIAKIRALIGRLIIIEIRIVFKNLVRKPWLNLA